MHLHHDRRPPLDLALLDVELYRRQASPRHHGEALFQPSWVREPHGGEAAGLVQPEDAQLTPGELASPHKLVMREEEKPSSRGLGFDLGGVAAFGPDPSEKSDDE